MPKNQLRRLTTIAMLIAIGIVLAEIVQISYPPQSPTFIRFSLGYLTILLVGILFGPVYGMIAGAIQDVLGFYVATLLSGVLPWVSAPGAFFIGYTLNAMLYGLVPGLLFKKTLANEDRVYQVLSWILSGAMLIGSVWFLCRVDLIRASYLGLTEKTVIAGISVGVALLMNVLMFVFSRKPKGIRPPFKLLFTLTVLYIVTSLVLTPIWIVYFYLGHFSTVTYVSFWVLLPIRIVKMPIDILLYLSVLPRLLRVSRTALGFEPEPE
jgi:ECF transporter S component (folate family)